MKKIISTVLAAVMVMSLAGTAEAGSVKKYGKDKSRVAARMVSPDDLKDNYGTMLFVEEYIVEWGYSLEYTVTYDGYVYHPYNYGMEMSDRDLLCIYNFCLASEDGKFDGYKENACDGSTYTFTYYDMDGKAHELYSGYCYDNEELQSVMEILDKYYYDIECEEWAD